MKCGGRNYAARMKMKVILHAQTESVAQRDGNLVGCVHPHVCHTGTRCTGNWDLVEREPS